MVHLGERSFPHRAADSCRNKAPNHSGPRRRHRCSPESQCRKHGCGLAVAIFVVVVFRRRVYPSPRPFSSALSASSYQLSSSSPSSNRPARHLQSQSLQPRRRRFTATSVQNTMKTVIRCVSKYCNSKLAQWKAFTRATTMTSFTTMCKGGNSDSNGKHTENSDLEYVVGDGCRRRNHSHH